MGVSLKRVTIDDVAHLAGVSIKTVSRVLNREPKVRESTRERVTQAMEALKYRPNSSARRLAGNCSYLLGLLYDNPSPSYVTSIQGGVLEACRAEHYDILIHPCIYDSPDFMGEIADLLAGARVDGLILTPPLSDQPALRKLLRKLQIPNVVISISNEGDSRWTVDTNDREVCADMVRYLAGLGHQRIAFVQGHPDHKAIAQRFEGFQDGMKESGLKVSKSLCLQGYNTFDSGVKCGKQLLNRKVRPTAIFCANDDMAAGVLKVAHEMNIAIPGELSVAGFDDIPLASQYWPSLTTVRQPTHDMAKLATELLIKRLRTRTPEGARRVLISELVIRDSTGPVTTSEG
jgi:LacI family transcriptional regulator